MNANEKDTFNYTYSAREREEIKKIRDKYTTPEKKQEDNITRLRRLDASVYRKASVVALIIGIIGTLVLGSGMSLIMTDISEIIGLYKDLSAYIGIAVGIMGLLLVIVAYPIYEAIVRKERKKIAPEIIRLTDELMK